MIAGSRQAVSCSGDEQEVRLDHVDIRKDDILGGTIDALSPLVFTKVIR